MTINNSYQDYTLPDWKKFIMGEKGQYSTRSLIIESWMRCYEASVNPYGNIIHSKLDEAAMFSMLLEKRELIEIAKPFMMNLYSFVEGSGFVVALTDERGYIMEMFGDEDTLNNPMTSNFFQGALWSEREGTNAIGTALMIKEAVQVSGAEHYCQKHHCLTCSAAPIFNPTGQVIGILDMSGASYTSHLHTLGMVAAAAEAITAQLAIQRKNRELAEANKRLTNLFNTMSDGVLMVDECGIIKQINPAAKDILSTIEHEIVGMPMDRLFGNKNVIAQLMLHSKESYEEIECIVDTKNSMFHCLASGDPLLDEQGRVIGGVILLRPKPTQNLENRFNGYQVTLQFGDVIGESAAIVEAIRVASLAAPTASTILLQGESGTGKEIFAQAIHNRSKQRNGPFVAMNCGVIPKDLIGSELFGYAEGAFTGAKRGGKPGKFEFASGGTLFLDEIGDMPLEQQIALLRVLQEKNITRIGSDKMIPINTRIICATNKNLMEEVKKGRFRQDLYYRLNVITVNIPPLRERKADIPLLFTNFLERIGRERNCKFCADPQVIECLQQFDWPGNVRELQNVVERAVNLSGTEMITAVHLPIEICAGINPPVALDAIFSQVLKGNFGRIERKKILENAEKQQIILFLTKHGGNVSEVARELKISRNTLYRKMHLYGVEN